MLKSTGDVGRLQVSTNLRCINWFDLCVDPDASENPQPQLPESIRQDGIKMIPKKEKNDQKFAKSAIPHEIFGAVNTEFY